MMRSRVETAAARWGGVVGRRFTSGCCGTERVSPSVPGRFQLLMGSEGPRRTLSVGIHAVGEEREALPPPSVMYP